jgi:hypothetical protein
VGVGNRLYVILVVFYFPANFFSAAPLIAQLYQSKAFHNKKFYSNSLVFKSNQFIGDLYIHWLDEYGSEPFQMMVMGCAFSCLDPVLSVVTALDYKTPFYITNKASNTCDPVRYRIPLNKAIFSLNMDPQKGISINVRFRLWKNLGSGSGSKIRIRILRYI